MKTKRWRWWCKLHGHWRSTRWGKERSTVVRENGKVICEFCEGEVWV